MLDSLLNRESKNQIYTNLLCLYALLFPLVTLFGNWCLGIFILFWLFNKGEWENKSNWNSVPWVFVLYFGLHVLGLLYTTNLTEGYRDLGSKGALLILPFVFSTILFSRAALQKILVAFVVGIILSNLIYLACACYRYWILDSSSVVFFYTGLTDPFGNHPAYSASYSIFGLIYLVHHYFQLPSRKSLHSILHIAGAIFLWLMVIIYVSRMQILVMCSVLSLFVIWKLWPARKWFMGLIAIGLVWSITIITANSFSFVKDRLENGVELAYENQMANVRFDVWKTGIEIAQTSPIIGVGPGDLKELRLADYKKKNLIQILEAELNSHNQYIESLAGLGIIGLLSYLLLLGLPSLRAFQANSFIIIAFFTIFILGTLTECMLETHRGSVWLAVLGSLFWGREKLLADE